MMIRRHKGKEAAKAKPEPKQTSKAKPKKKE